MVKYEEMTNGKIYELATTLINNFNDDIVLPVKVNFYLQKNMNSLIEMGREIETSRMEILNKYGELDEEGQQYHFEPDKMEKATSEIKDLMDLTQEVKINTIELDSFNDIQLTRKQISAISFMIED